jgi:putative hydrolase of the HAD superfamily
VRDIRTITLDLDDTLWAIRPVIERAEQALHDWLSAEYPRIGEMFSAEDIIELREAVIAEHWERNHDFTFLRRVILARLGVAAGYGDGLVDDAMAVFSAARNDVEVFPEVRPTLSALREEYCVIAVTNGNADVDRIGISDLFHEVISASSAGAAKPSRRIFETAVQAGGASPDQTLHVGDHPEVDVAGANEAGLKSVWVNRHGHDWPDHLRPPDGVVRDVGELLDLLGVEAR